jgi:hypothetical protein
VVSGSAVSGPALEHIHDILILEHRASRNSDNGHWPAGSDARHPVAVHDVGAVRQHLVENIPRSVRLWPLLANFLGNQTVA